MKTRMKKLISIVLVLVLGLAAKVAKADFTFGTPTNLGPVVNSSSREFNASISADGLSLFFISNRPGGVGGRDIWVTARATKENDWGFVWDGSHRVLYVDSIMVAEDTQDNLTGSENGLYIGTGKGMEPGTYWSGLIDDVRIYNRVVIP